MIKSARQERKLTQEELGRLEATIRNFRIVQMEGKRQVERDVEFYNLEMIFFVSCRVNSDRAMQY